MADPKLMTADDASVSEKTSAPIYGLYLNGALVLNPDSFLGYDYTNDSRISQYPQEAGSFQQYNKVDTPFDTRIQMTKGGSVTDIAAFIKTAEGLAKATDLNLYTIITPERTYSSVNVSKVTHSHKRDHGANMVTVELHLTEIRVTASAQYSNTTSPTTSGNLSDTKAKSASDPKNTGTVQPQTPPAATVSSVTDALAAAELAQNHRQMTH